MKDLIKRAVVMLASGMGLGMSGVVLGATGAGPYYATPSWDQSLPASTRFIELTNMPGAVLDRETGLVWEKSPEVMLRTWRVAQTTCADKNVGGRKGWKLPSIQELTTLIDPTVPAPGPTLPAGHPFINVQQSEYWASTTTYGASIDSAYQVFFDLGVITDSGKVFTGYVWCVRGGSGSDPQ